MIIDAHMHIWKRIKGCVRNEQPVRPLGSGKIRIGDQEILGMPASFVDCSALAEYVLAEGEKVPSAAAFVLSPYMGLTKKFGGRIYASATLGAGVDMLTIAGKYTYYSTEYDYTLAIMALGFKGGGELGMMLTPDLSLTASANFKMP